ncbi:MAG: sulfite exporter TauE/SafE family protein [Thermoleophilia bacterium]
MPSTSQKTAASPRSSRRGASAASRVRSETVTPPDPSTGPRSPGGVLLPLALTGLTAGLFASLFGVGGGVVMVPLLIALLGYDARVATATSLAAIIFTATAGTVTHGALGNVQWDTALLVGLPAMVGVNLGIALKDRMSSRALTYAFVVLLLAVAVRIAVA